MNCSDWLLYNAVPYENHTVWEYNYPLPDRNLTPPWISGIAQGQGIQVLVRAYNITSDQKYLKVANSSLQVFYIEYKNGGLTYKDPETGGWWYEEYPGPDPSEDRVLNGHMHALVGIHEYYVRTGDESAKYLLEKGIIELKNNLPNYDTGEWTYYDHIGNNASIHYHHTHVLLLGQLYGITSDPVFEQYYQKWKSYEDDPLLKYEHMNKKEKAVYVFIFFAVYMCLEIILFVFNRNGKI